MLHCLSYCPIAIKLYSCHFSMKWLRPVCIEVGTRKCVMTCKLQNCKIRTNWFLLPSIHSFICYRSIIATFCSFVYHNKNNSGNSHANISLFMKIYELVSKKGWIGIKNFNSSIVHKRNFQHHQPIMGLDASLFLNGVNGQS